jgi:hypothetical protein
MLMPSLKRGRKSAWLIRLLGVLICLLLISEIHGIFAF